MDIFSVFFNMKVCCVFSLESLRRGDSNEYTQYTMFNIKKKITLTYPKYAAMGFFFQETWNEFEKAVVNEPSVFEPQSKRESNSAAECYRIRTFKSGTPVTCRCKYLQLSLK